MAEKTLAVRRLPTKAPIAATMIMTFS